MNQKCDRQCNELVARPITQGTNNITNIVMNRHHHDELTLPLMT